MIAQSRSPREVWVGRDPLIPWQGPLLLPQGDPGILPGSFGDTSGCKECLGRMELKCGISGIHPVELIFLWEQRELLSSFTFAGSGTF